jgi:hypothetical protein
MELARAVPLALIALLAAVTPASAATVRLNPGGGDESAFLVYTAADGEQNKLSVSVDRGQATVDDPGASSIDPQQGCQAITPKRAICDLQDSTATINYVEAHLGDGNDEVDLIPSENTQFVGLVAKGGGGDDKLRGARFADSLDGGTGRDALHGGEGSDSFTTADATGAADADVIDGGADFDSFHGYAERTTPVTADTFVGTGAGEAGENDTLSSIEGLTGGHANDTLRGDSYNDHLHGGNGDDVLVGEPGDDYLSGGPGNDSLDGGVGNDEFEAGAGDDTIRLNNYEGQYDRFVACNEGNDTVGTLMEPLPAVSIDCELLDLGFGLTVPTLPRRVTTTYVAMSIPCPARYRGADGVCAGKLAVEPRMAFRNSKSKRFRDRYGAREFRFKTQSARITVPLNARGRKELRKPFFRLQFTLRLNDQVKKRVREFAWTENFARFTLRQRGVG